MLAVLLMMPSLATAVQVGLVKHTPQCFDCETVYSICKDSNMNPQQAAFELNFKGRDSQLNKTFLASIYLENRTTYIQQEPMYSVRQVNSVVISNITGLPINITVNETYISGVQNISVPIIKWDQPPLNYYAGAFRSASIGTCWNISIRGRLRPGEAIDNFISVGGVNYTQWAWWNNSYNQRYDLNLTENQGIARIYEPLTINMTDIGCAFANKSDMRIMINDTYEQPFYLRSDNIAIMVVNVSESFSGRYAYIYCNNSAAGAYSYNLGMTLQVPGGTPTNGVNISLGYNNTVFKMEKRMNIGTLITDGGFNFSHANFWEGMGALYQGGANDVQGTWSALDSSPNYVRINYKTTTPAPTGYNITIEFYPYNLMARIRTTDKFTYLTGIISDHYILGNPSPPGTNGVRLADDTHVTYNLNNGWAASTTSTKGLITEYSSTTYTHVASIFFNESGMAGTPLKKCFHTGDGSDPGFPQMHVCGSSCDCGGTNYFNISYAGSNAGLWWYGFAPNAESSFNQTYKIKMNPLQVTLSTTEYGGGGEPPAANNTCTYPGSGVWTINCADGCNITGAQTASVLHINGTGITTFTGVSMAPSTLVRITGIDSSNKCTVRLLSTSIWKLI